MQFKKTDHERDIIWVCCTVILDDTNSSRKAQNHRSADTHDFTVRHAQHVYPDPPHTWKRKLFASTVQHRLTQDFFCVCFADTQFLPYWRHLVSLCQCTTDPSHSNMVCIVTVFISHSTVRSHPSLISTHAVIFQCKMGLLYVLSVLSSHVSLRYLPPAEGARDYLCPSWPVRCAPVNSSWGRRRTFCKLSSLRISSKSRFLSFHSHRFLTVVWLYILHLSPVFPW